MHVRSSCKDAIFMVLSFGQEAHMPMAMTMQLKVETDIDNRVWATKMAKNVMTINRQLKTLLLSLTKNRLFVPDPNRIDFLKTNGKKLTIRSLVQEEENQ